MKIEISDSRNWQHSLTLKLALLAIMGLFLLIPLEMIKNMIRERQANSERVKAEIASLWAGPQTIAGPVLNVPARIIPAKKDSEPYEVICHIMPERLDIEGKVQTEKRKRGIFGAVVYTADLNMSVSYSIPEISGDQPSEIIWSKAYFSMGISDKRGLRGDIPFKSGSSDLEVLPGIREKHLFNSGITVPVTLSGEEEVLSCRLHILLSGSDELNFSPVGKTTRVSLQSSWADPGFRGNFLPSERVVNDKGFSAGWLITDLNRNFPQVWTGDKFDIAVDAFGVSFILLVDHYQKSLRSAKYGILFIALTFLALLFTELKSRVKFNIFHYLLFSLAVLLFFSLLNALSEQVGFNMAYLLSASLTIILVSAFLRALVMNTSQVLLFSGLLLFLYSFIYILLNLNDYAYLAGNIGLFILLSITMWISVRLRLFDTSC